MLAAVNREIEVIMIPVGRLPGGLRVTCLTGVWKLGGLMVRIIGLVVVTLVTSITCVRRIVIVSVVTGSTLVCYRRMSSEQRIIGVVIGE